ncbi:MAG: hypothetical protein HUU46_12000 [Candidatus Hydrogenedentes bacterium]|nr:hypothetical protein [Candidatus Hydrogenedentota bacterium]
MNWVRTTPRRVWIICALFALLQPLTHALVIYCAPDDVIPTGLHKPDSAIFVHTMRMFETGFYSPYVTCRSELGDHSWRLFTTPFFLLYGIAGALGSLADIGAFTMLGLANGFCAACYLLAVYHFMRTILPKHADRAFVLFTFSGGLGGVTYAACAVFGVADTPAFSQWFYRFAIYDLVEGTNLAPYLLMPRLYYTLPLALGFAGLTSLLVSWRIQCPVHLAYSQALLFVCVLLNARLGPPLGGIALLYLAHERSFAWRRLAHAALPIALGVACASGIMRLNPSFVANVHSVVRQQMWFTSFVSAGFPLLMFACPLIVRDARALTGALRAVTFGGLGFLGVFTALFFFYQFYYGTVLTGADHAASVSVSDIALTGVALGLVWSALGPRAHGRPEHGWLIAWAVLFTAVAVSAFGQGWFLRFSPQRLMVFLGVPLSLLAAEAIRCVETVRPRLATACVAFVIGIGVPAIAVSSLVFQGPLGMRPGLASDIGMHTAYLREEDAECLAELGPGVVAAPWPYNDILSTRDGVRVLGGYGAADLSGEDAGELAAQVAEFFTPGTNAVKRGEFLERWCVNHVYLPSDAKARDILEVELDRLQAIHRIYSIDGAVLYAVN